MIAPVSPSRTCHGIAVSAALFLILFILIVPAAANPPSSMQAVYNQNSRELGVTILHPVNNIPGHYIKTLKITVNGNVVNESSFTGQPTDTFTVTFPLALGPGDVAEATATCSLAGSGTAIFIMPGPTAPGPGSPPAAGTPGTPLPAAVTLAGFGCALAIRRLSPG